MCCCCCCCCCCCLSSCFSLHTATAFLVSARINTHGKLSDASSLHNATLTPWNRPKDTLHEVKNTSYRVQLKSNMFSTPYPPSPALIPKTSALPTPPPSPPHPRMLFAKRNVHVSVYMVLDPTIHNLLLAVSGLQRPGSEAAYILCMCFTSSFAVLPVPYT